MNKQFNNTNLYILWMLPFIYLVFVYPRMPQRIPVHFNFHGADGYGDKPFSWIFVIIMTTVSFLIYSFLKNTPVINPKPIGKIALGLVFFFTALQLIAIHAMETSLSNIQKTLLPLFGLLFAFLGNQMHSLKPNYFIGIRTPWTLESEDNWCATHRIGGRVWFAGGLLLAILCLILSASKIIIAFISVTAMIALVPVIYSFIYFKQHKN